MAELAGRTAGLSAKLRSTHCNLLFDEVQPFDGKGTHSTGVLAIQVIDVDARDRGKSEMVAIIAVIPGPKKPSTMAPYLSRAIDELLVLFREGFVVEHRWEEVTTEGVTVVCAAFKLHPELVGILADTPARLKMCGHAGVGAYIGSCPFCIFEGVYIRHPSGYGGTMRYIGFWEPVVQRIRYGNPPG